MLENGEILLHRLQFLQAICASPRKDESTNVTGIVHCPIAPILLRIEASLSGPKNELQFVHQYHSANMQK
jgi:hypothetical protein